jgi:hypothetical protein
MNPWDNIDEDLDPDEIDNLLAPLWEKFKPKDFYFAICYSDAVAKNVVYITPATFFDKTGFMYPDSMPIRHLLPDYLIEVYKSIYVSNANIDYSRIDLQTKGFVNNWKFQEFVAGSEFLSEI